MPAGYDASSDIYSLYSQPMTRSSTLSHGTDPLETPLDETLIGRGPKGVIAGRYDATRIRAATPDAAQLYVRGDRPLSALPEANEGDLTPGGGDYFSILPVAQASPSPLSRRGTTKELIGRWESISSRAPDDGRPASHRPRPTRNPSANTMSSDGGRQSLWAPAANHGGDTTADAGPGEKKKGKSPIRQSVRNFLSVFKKGRHSGSGKDVVEKTPEPPLQRLSLEVPILRMDGPAVPLEKNEKILCTSPLGAKGGLSGPLLYLARTGSPDTHSVWMDCTAELHSTHVLVTWHTASGNPFTTVVSFKHCTDVRSLAVHDLSPGEKALLPSGPSAGDPKIFELLFEGRPREKFVASSIAERATWVSAIWDAILQAGEERTEASSIRSRVLASPMPPEEPASAWPSSFSTNTTVASGGSKMTVNRDRELPQPPPPTPQPASPVKESPIEPVRYQLHDPPVTPTSIRSARSPLSALPKPPATPTSLAPPLTPSRSQSPSVRNLGQLSMVKQRLAQIESRGSESPTRASPSPAPRATASAVQRPEMSRQESATSYSGASSVIDAYGSNLTSPSSQYSERLTSVPSVRTPLRIRTDLAPSAEERSSIMRTPMGSAISPTSRYSAETHSSPTSGLLARLERTTSLKATDERVVIAPLDFQSKEPSAAPPRPLPVPSQPPREEDPQMRSSMQAITQSLQWLQGQSTISGNNLYDVQQKVTAILEELREHMTAAAGNGVAPAEVDLSSVLQRLEEMRLDMNTASDARAQEMAELKAAKDSSVAGQPAFAASELHAKLDDIVAVCRDLRASGTGLQQGSENHVNFPADKVEEVLEILKTAQPHWSAGSEQQLESVRYLNELNSWLEAFVNHGAAQMDGVASGVQRLCTELGVIPESQREGEEEAAMGQQLGGGVLAQIRGLLSEMNEKEGASTALHGAVNGLVAAVQEDLRMNAETRNALAAESIVGLITRQREDHERMLRVLGTELSNEIRGERLRFVEAMKEATQINVHTHVEEFKKELTREVVLMTQDVQRLQKERQDMEQQIADLFAFYSRQKQMIPAVTSSQRTPTRSRHAPPPLQARQRSAPLPLQIPQPAGGRPPLQSLQIMPGSLYGVPVVSARRPLPSPMSRPTSRPGSTYG